jgi:hypothetical protein
MVHKRGLTHLEMHTMEIPKHVSDRLASGLRRFQPVLHAAKSRDVGECDTAMIVTDMLAEVFGYAKYDDITREHPGRGKTCDLAMKIGGEIQSLIKVKPIGSELRDDHLEHTLDYATHRGVEWVVLTNGQHWKAFSVSLSTPTCMEIFLDLDVLAIAPHDEAAIASLFLLAKEGIEPSSLAARGERSRARSRFNLAAIVLSAPVIGTIGSEVSRLFPGVEMSGEEIREKLVYEVLKRDVLDGDKASEARRLVARVPG